MRRQYIRLLRLRNLTAITVILVLLYLFRTWSNDWDQSVIPHKNALRSEKIPIFVPSSLKVTAILGDHRGQSVIPHKNPMTSEKIPIFVPSSLKKIDWHDYAQILEDSRRIGIGEQGKPGKLPPSDAALEEKLYAANGFNGALSDRIALNRSLPDIRHPLCKKRQYIESLPDVSVVVPFHNEHWSTLLRTATGAVERAPPRLLREVLLVDDASTKEFLKEQLERYLAAHLPKVRVLRLARRGGLIAARLAGARAAAGAALVFLDSHTEPTHNWLPPLLEPIALDYRTAVCPFIDVVAHDSFEYRAQDEGARGAFDWELFYKRLPLLPRDLAAMPEPFPSPVMAGGLFAISRAFFWQLGGYDPGLDIWGGEQYELSFKIWQCGGRLLDAPCSRVGHIYRKFAPFPNPGHGDFVGKNYRRVAEVWMDEYAAHLYRRRPHYRRLPLGDVSPQLELRRRLRCLPFRWFMTQVAFDLTAHYPPVEPKPFGEGRIRPLANPHLCLDAHRGAPGDRLWLAPCSPLSEQEFVLTWHKDVRSKDRGICWDLPESAAGSPVLLYSCHLGGGNQEWRLDMTSHQIRKSDTVCLDWDAPSLGVFVRPCDAAAASQRWTLDNVDLAALAQWDAARRAVTAPEVDDWQRGETEPPSQ